MIFGTEQQEDDLARTRTNYNSVGTGVEVFRNMKEFVFGAGTNKILGNKEGFAIGGVNYSTAPYQVSYGGILYATAGTIAGDFTVSGSLFSDDGSAFQTQLTLGKISFLKSGTEKGYIKTATGSNGLQLSSAGSIYFTNLAGATYAELDSISNLKFSADAYISWPSGRKLTASASAITCDGDFKLSTGNRYYIAGDQGASGTYDPASGNKIKFVGGIATDLNA